MRRWLPALGLGLVLCAPAAARAALVGSIFSGPTTGDGAAVYQNPAAMTLVGGTHAMIFGSLSAIRLDYLRDTPNPIDGQPYPLAEVFVPKPNFAFGVVTDATLRDFRFGIGASLPIIDGASWKREYGGKPASTRYYALDARLAQFLIEPAVAYRINRYISIGVGLDIVGVLLSHEVMTDFGAKVNHMACALNPAAPCPLDAPLPREDPTYDGLTTIEGMGWGVGAFGGVLVTPAPWIRIGVGFHSGAGGVKIPVDLGVEIPAAVTDYVGSNLPSVTLPPLTAEGEVTAHSPMSVTAGVAVYPTERLEIAADLHWMDYSETAVLMGIVTRADELGLIGTQVLIKDRTDYYLVGLRGAYRALDCLRLALRLEYEANNRPEQFVTPVSIDFHKVSIHAGVAWRATRWMTLTLEYGHYFMPAREIDRSLFGPQREPTTPVDEGFDKPSPTGRYTVQVDRVGGGAMVSF